MPQFFRYPASGSASANPSVGTNGITAPTSSTEVAGINPSGNLQPLQTDGSGALITTPSPTGTQNENLTQVGGTAITLGQKTATASLPVILASDQGALPLSTGASTSALQTTGNASLSSIDSKTPALGQALSAGSVPVVLTAAQLTTLTPLTSVTVTQATGTNLHTVVDSGSISVSNFPASQPISGTVTVVQPTGTNLHTVIDNASITVTGAFFQATQPVSATSLPLPTGASTAANQTSVIGSAAAGTAATNSELVGGLFNTSLPTLTNGQQAAIQLDSSGRQIVAPLTNTSVVTSQAGTPTARTITNAAITVGTTAVRLTVSGSAPASTRVVLVATPDTASTATFYIGTSTVTNSGATRGIAIVAGQSFIANNDAGDYYIVSSTAAQTVEVMEQA